MKKKDVESKKRCEIIMEAVDNHKSVSLVRFLELDPNDQQFILKKVIKNHN